VPFVLLLSRARPQVVKVDTEGAERDILRQLKPWLERYRPTLILSWHVFAYLDVRSSGSSSGGGWLWETLQRAWTPDCQLRIAA
jgi:hypothetical protein